MWHFIFGVALGVAIGRVYGWMKYRYPESREMIALKIARLRAERAKVEAEEEKFRTLIDESLDQRMGVK
jgi:hypothetical protein